MPQQGMIFSASNIAEQLRQYNVNYDQRRTWDQLHLENQQYAAAGQGAITQNLDQNIEQAYTAHLQSQAGISGSRLGQGQKNVFSEQLRRQTDAAYQQASVQAAGYQQTLNEQVSAQAGKIEGALYQQGQYTADLLSSTVDYWSELLETNPDLANDPLWAKYFAEAGLDALSEEERTRYDELMDKNDLLVDEVKADMTNLGDFKNELEELQTQLASLGPVSPHSRDATAAQKRRLLNQKIEDLTEKIQDAELKEEYLATGNNLLLDDELVEMQALQEKMAGEKRAMTRDDLMLSMFDTDEEGNWNMNIAGQDFFDQIFNERVGDDSFGRWLKDQDDELFNFFTSANEFDYRGATQNQIRDMLGVGQKDYTYSFLERMGGMSEDQLKSTFDVFDTSLNAIAFNEDKTQAISDLSTNMTELMSGLGIDADFERETGIKMSELDKGIKTAIDNIVAGKDMNAAFAGTVLSNIVGGAGLGTTIGGATGVGALVGTVVGGLIGLVGGVVTAGKEMRNTKENNKRMQLMVQREYSKMMDQLSTYMQERTQAAEQKFEQNVRRF